VVVVAVVVAVAVAVAGLAEFRFKVKEAHVSSSLVSLGCSLECNNNLEDNNLEECNNNLEECHNLGCNNKDLMGIKKAEE